MKHIRTILLNEQNGFAPSVGSILKAIGKPAFAKLGVPEPGPELKRFMEEPYEQAKAALVKYKTTWLPQVNELRARVEREAKDDKPTAIDVATPPLPKSLLLR